MAMLNNQMVVSMSIDFGMNQASINILTSTGASNITSYYTPYGSMATV